MLLAPFAEYLRSFTDDPAGAGAAERPGRRGLPFLRRSLPQAVRLALPAARSAPACHWACARAHSGDAAAHLRMGGRRIEWCHACMVVPGIWPVVRAWASEGLRHIPVSAYTIR